MKPFITVSNELLESLEKIVLSGLKGTHLLFSNEIIRDAYKSEQTVELLSNDELMEQLQGVLADLVELEDLEDRRDFIQTLPPDIRDLLVHLYFGFLDKYMDEDGSPEVLH
jgi:hypothetical protein